MELSLAKSQTLPFHGQRSFLALPLEIRRRIYYFLLPWTYLQNDTGSLFHFMTSGDVSILRTNHQIFSEAITVLFENITFYISVHEQGVVILFLGQDVVGKESLDFHLANYVKYYGTRNLWRTRQLFVHISARHEDPDLEACLNKNITFLCSHLCKIPSIGSLYVEFEDYREAVGKSGGPKDCEIPTPLTALQNVDHCYKVSTSSDHDPRKNNRLSEPQRDYHRRHLVARNGVCTGSEAANAGP